MPILFGAFALYTNIVTFLTILISTLANFPLSASANFCFISQLQEKFQNFWAVIPLDF
jgi:hypothetical protein